MLKRKYTLVEVIQYIMQFMFPFDGTVVIKNTSYRDTNEEFLCSYSFASSVNAFHDRRSKEPKHVRFKKEYYLQQHNRKFYN